MFVNYSYRRWRYGADAAGRLGLFVLLISTELASVEAEIEKRRRRAFLLNLIHPPNPRACLRSLCLK